MFFLLIKELNRRLACQYKELLIFNFKINYIKGSENNAIDVLNRRANYIVDIQQSSRAILVQNPNKSLGPNRVGLYIAAIITIKVEGLTIYILEDLIKDKVIVEILKDINNYNLFSKIDLRLLIF